MQNMDLSAVYYKIELSGVLLFADNFNAFVRWCTVTYIATVPTVHRLHLTFPLG